MFKPSFGLAACALINLESFFFFFFILDNKQESHCCKTEAAIGNRSVFFFLEMMVLNHQHRVAPTVAEHQRQRSRLDRTRSAGPDQCGIWIRTEIRCQGFIAFYTPSPHLCLSIHLSDSRMERADSSSPPWTLVHVDSGGCWCFTEGKLISALNRNRRIQPSIHFQENDL